MLLDIALKNLWRRRLRSTLTILGVAVAVQLYITMSGIMSWYNGDMQRQLGAFAGRIYIQQRMETAGSGQDFPSLSSSLTAETAEGILQLAGVDRSASSAALFAALSLSSSPNANPPLLAVGLEMDHEASLLGSLEPQAGALVLSDSHSAILGSQAASHYRVEGSDRPLQPGQTFELRGETFTVVGVLKPAAQLFNGLLVIPLDTARCLFNRPDSVSAVILTTTSVENVPQIKQEIALQYPKLEASSQDDLIKNADDILANQRKFFGFINNTVILIAVVAIMVVVFIAVMEQRKDIGTLRAIGARRWRIFTLVAGEALLLSLFGAILALPLSWIMSKAVLAQVTRQTMYTTETWLTILGLSVAIGILAALLPAWLAVRVDPLEALRYE
jgi:putative ABC transport system permease protein